MSDITIKEYLERLLDEADRRYEERFRSFQISIDKAEDALSKRLDGMNEFREALKDQANDMATSADLERVDELVRELQRARANLDGRIVAIIAAISTIVSMLVVVLGWTVFR